MDKFDWFKDKFENTLSEEEQVQIFNDFCDENGFEEKIYSMCEFDDIFADKKPSEVFNMVQSNMDDVDFNDEYFVITVYGFRTFSDPHEFIEDYLGDICDKMHNDYIEEMYDGHFDLKPEDMDDDEFYDIVENAVYSNDHESDIIEDIKKAVSED